MDRWILIVLVMLSGFLVPTGVAGENVLRQSVLGNGGVAASNGSHAAFTCAGQLATGIASGPTHLCRQGFWYLTSHYCSDVEPIDGGVSQILRLKPARPNPSRHSTALDFAIPTSGRVVLKLYDISGRQVATLVDRDLEAGIHTARLDAGTLPSGVYFCLLAAAGSTRTTRLILLR